MDNPVFLTKNDATILKQVIDEFRNRTRTALNRSPSSPEENSSGVTIYVALTPASGIPALSPSSSGTGGFDSPAGVECSIYRLLDVDLVPINQYETIYNLSTSDVPGGKYIRITRDPWGTWYAEGESTSSGGTVQTLTTEITSIIGTPSYTTRSNCLAIWIRMIGAGGGGGGANAGVFSVSDFGSAGGGGGGGGGIEAIFQDAQSPFHSIASKTFTLSIGVGGVGGSHGVSGSNGGDTTLTFTDAAFVGTCLITSSGGKGGSGGLAAAESDMIAGGDGGSANAPGDSGTSCIYGGVISGREGEHGHPGMIFLEGNVLSGAGGRCGLNPGWAGRGWVTGQAPAAGDPGYHGTNHSGGGGGGAASGPLDEPGGTGANGHVLIIELLG